MIIQFLEVLPDPLIRDFFLHILIPIKGEYTSSPPEVGTNIAFGDKIFYGFSNIRELLDDSTFSLTLS